MKSFLKKNLFALVLGLIDGILTVLTLATGKVLDKTGEEFSLSLALRVAFVTAISGCFVYFISEYTKQRHALVKFEKELNLTRHGKLVTSNLGKQIIKETMVGAFISGSFSFLGAFIPISGAVFFPQYSWFPIIIALLILAALGLSMASLVYGNSMGWVLALLLAGLVVSFIGYELHVIS
jgi:predicted membrane protein (TIGR00267 family)